MPLHPGEPPVTAWREVDLAGFADRVGRRLPARGGLILVDGGGGSGKSTLAQRLSSQLGAALVHTDDVAWQLHPVEWADALIDGVLTPWRRGEPVAFRPPGWLAKDRPGCVSVAAGAPVLVVEGVGAGRNQLAGQADCLIWMQLDRQLARERGLVRDVERGRSRAEAEAFWDDWDTHELPFLTRERPWRAAAYIVDGAGRPADLVQFADGPLGRLRAR